MASVSETQPRPRHATLAAALVIGGSVGVVVTAAEQIAGLQSLETREQVIDFLAAPPGSDLGLDVATALAALRVVLMVVAGCATAAIVLGVEAMRGTARARIGLAILAVPIFLGGFATGGLLTSLVAAGTVLLFVGPSGMWFRGEPIPESLPLAARVGAASRSGPSRSGPSAPADYPPPLPVRQPAEPRQPFGTPPGPQPVSAQVSHRPDAVVWACVLTWAFSAIAIAVMAGSSVLMATNPDLVFDELARQNRDLPGSDPSTLTEATYATAAVAGLWSLAAIVIAAFAYRGQAWARKGVMASAAVVGVVCLLGTFSTLLLIAPASAALATVTLLNRPEVRAWFART